MMCISEKQLQEAHTSLGGVFSRLARFFFHYSGHGGSVQDVSGDEDDGFDETIYPVDFENYEGESGQIIDDVRWKKVEKRENSEIVLIL